MARPSSLRDIFKTSTREPPFDYGGGIGPVMQPVISFEAALPFAAVQC